MLAKREEGQGCYLSTALGALVIVALVEWIWPDVIPFTIFQFWRFDGTIEEVLKVSWPAFVWGSGVTTVFAIRKWNDPFAGWEEDLNLKLGLLSSTFAGVMEEISFRWLIFYNEIIGYKLINWLIFGWAVLTWKGATWLWHPIRSLVCLPHPKTN